jgi:hypothetical protein
MPSAAQIKKMVKQAIVKVGDLASVVTYVSVVVGAYDPVNNTTNDTETQYTLRAVVTGLNEEESAWFLPDAITQKLIIAALDLPVKPERADYVLIDGTRWEVKKIKGVPGNSLWRIYVQEP